MFMISETILDESFNSMKFNLDGYNFLTLNCVGFLGVRFEVWGVD